MTDTPLIAVGASAGGVEALIELVSGIDAGLPAAMLVVLHQPASAPTVLHEILDRHCTLEVVPARQGDDLRPGRIHVATPDHHLQVANGRVVLTRGPTSTGHRPGVDPLFRSVALQAGPRATGVVLSGLLDDGAAGVLDIVRHGGVAVVQDPDEASFPSMPLAALSQVPGAVVRRAKAIGAVLHEVAARAPTQAPSPGSVGSTHDDAVMRALHSAVRSLEDKAVLHHRIAQSAQRSGAGRVAAQARAAMRGALDDATILRRLLANDADAGRSGPGSDHGDTSGTSCDE